MENIHLPKMPKIHKPAFLKKKKEDGDEEGAEKGEEGKEEGEEKKDDEAKGEDETTEEGKKDKKSFMDNLKNMKSQVHVPAFLSKKGSKDKDPEAGDNEESKELLEKKEGEDGEKKEEGEEGEKKEETDDDAADKPDDKTTTAPSRGAALLESLRNVASQVPSMFKKQKEKEPDVEAGEKDELLEKEGEKKPDELEEVKVDDSDKKKDPDAASQKSEKKDPEKGDDEGDDKKPLPFQQHLDRAKEVGDQCVQRFNSLDQQKKLIAFGVAGALLLLILIIVICAAAKPSGWSNEARIVGEGKFVETHTSCGPIQGLVDGPDQFSFTRIPYASTPEGTKRWTHSTAATNLAECHEGKMIAHSHNNTKPQCWKRYPTGPAGDENCLTLDIFTSTVVYNQLMPVVVYVDGGDDLDSASEAKIQPSSALAKNHSVVFVSVNYRRGVFGFLSLNSLSDRTYPKSSGNYGLGDIIAALEWIKLNIQHFGGHPAQVTLLGRGSGATLVTTLTATPKAKSLFKQAWVTNGAGVLSDKELDEANRENKVCLCIRTRADSKHDKQATHFKQIKEPEVPTFAEK